LQKHRAHFIPNGLYFILTRFQGKSSAEIKQAFGGAHDRTIDQYFAFLLRHKYGFICTELERFPDMDLSWDRPERVTNGIIDVDSASTHDYPSLFEQFDRLGCEAVQVRAFEPISVDTLTHIVRSSAGRRLRHLDVVVKYAPALSDEYLRELCVSHQWLAGITVHSSPEGRIISLHPYPVSIRFIETSLTISCCGQVGAAYFAINIGHFTEARRFNTCLNRKLSVCANGDLKNCPSMTVSFGNAHHDSLGSVLENPDWVRLGRINKDEIAVCSDCEFRYVCTDCRAYLADPTDLRSKPAKCTYDPYTATWAD
jgi:SPASM domain peptide maturase of grasp-with-spasm system